MADLTRRIHVLLSDEQVEFLKEMSQKEGRPMGDLLRSAFESKYRPASPIAALQALDRLEAMHEPLLEQPASGGLGPSLVEAVRPGFSGAPVSPITSGAVGTPTRAMTDTFRDQPVFVGALALAVLCGPIAPRRALTRHLRTVLQGGGRLVTSSESLRQVYAALVDCAGFPVLRRIRPVLESVLDDVLGIRPEDLEHALDLMELYDMPKDDAFELAAALGGSVFQVVSPSLQKAPPGVSVVFSHAFASQA